jgi:hypothetical protein
MGEKTNRARTKAAPGSKRMGRPPGGKRSDPDYMQTTLYVPRSLMTEIKVKLLRSDAHEFSGLVESLLRDWLKRR